MTRVAFYGDSIVTGWRGITAPDRRWSSIASADLGWHELDFAVDGLGFVRWRGPGRTHDGRPLGLVADVIASRADACVVALGSNDAVIVAEMEDDLRAAIERDLAVLLGRFGPDRLIVMDLYSVLAGQYPPGRRAVGAMLGSAAGAHGLQLVPGLTDTVRGHVPPLCGDGIHLNDAGHAALAAAVTPHLREALPLPRHAT